jgi:adenylate kinase family enzyme
LSIIVPKIVILGPPASGRHTIGKLLQKKFNAVLIEPEEILRDIPSKLKSKLPANPNIVCKFYMKWNENILS